MLMPLFVRLKTYAGPRRNKVLIGLGLFSALLIIIALRFFAQPDAKAQEVIGLELANAKVSNWAEKTKRLKEIYPPGTPRAVVKAGLKAAGFHDDGKQPSQLAPDVCWQVVQFVENSEVSAPPPELLIRWCAGSGEGISTISLTVIGLHRQKAHTYQ